MAHAEQRMTAYDIAVARTLRATPEQLIRRKAIGLVAALSPKDNEHTSASTPQPHTVYFCGNAVCTRHITINTDGTQTRSSKLIEPEILEEQRQNGVEHIATACNLHGGLAMPETQQILDELARQTQVVKTRSLQVVSA